MYLNGQFSSPEWLRSNIVAIARYNALAGLLSAGDEVFFRLFEPTGHDLLDHQPGRRASIQKVAGSNLLKEEARVVPLALTYARCQTRPATAQEVAALAAEPIQRDARGLQQYLEATYAADAPLIVHHLYLEADALAYRTMAQVRAIVPGLPHNLTTFKARDTKPLERLWLACAAATNVQARVQNLEAAVTDADMWLRRRAARHQRDRLCYRLGAALEPAGGLQVDDVFLSGLDLLGGHGVALLAAAALAAPGGTSLSELMVRMAPTKAGRIVRDWGAWSRFTWLRDLYRQVVADFEASPAGRDPRRSWRKAAPTARQQYLVGELARFLQLDRPEFVCRGDVHDWLRVGGGNPRFQVRPELPPLPTLADLTA